MLKGKTGGAVSIGPELLCNIWEHAYSRIRQFGLEQRRPGELVIRVVLYETRETPAIVAYFQRFFAERYRGQFEIRVQVATDLNLSSPGKQRYFVQHLNPAAAPR